MVEDSQKQDLQLPVRFVTSKRQKVCVCESKCEMKCNLQPKMKCETKIMFI